MNKQLGMSRTWIPSACASGSIARAWDESCLVKNRRQRSKILKHELERELELDTLQWMRGTVPL